MLGFEVGAHRRVMADNEGWFYLHPTGQHYGPYSVTDLHGLYAQGLVLPESLIWRQGEKEWLALKDVPEVQPGLPPAPEITGPGAAAAGTPPDAGQAGSAPAAAAGAGAGAAGAGADVLDLFQAEIDALEAGQEVDGAEDAPLSPEEKRFEDDDGTIYVWDSKLRKYVEEDAAQAATAAAAAALAYREEDMVYEADNEVIPEYRPPREGEEEEELLEALEAEKAGKGEVAVAGDGQADAAAEQQGGQHGARSKERQAGSKRQNEGTAEDEAAAKKAKQQEPQAWFEMKHNTSVYVTGLPEDVTEAELAEVFSKCGLVKEGEDKQPKVKVYRDRQSGIPKGDGLVTYLKEPSVLLALQILDGAHFRPGMAKAMTVTKAKFEQKGEQFLAKKAPNRSKKKKKGATAVDKALGWDGFDDRAKPTEVTVILKHMFHPDEFVGDPGVKTDLETDVAAECKKLGSIANIRVHQHNPEGVIAIRFVSPDAAQECLKLMNGRFFGGRQVEALMWDGLTNYHVKPRKETEEEQQARLDKFARELEGRDGALGD